MSRAGLSDAHRRFIQEHGGVITENRDGYAVEFPDGPEESGAAEFDGDSRTTAAAAEVEAAVQRAREYGTPCIRLWEAHGTGWYAAASRETHPGFWWRCQIDEETGRPLRCRCDASVVCHHLGAAILCHRERIGYEANGADALAAWEETVARINTSKGACIEEEEW